ncbi:MAG: HAMP domain-containing protein [Pseudomonadales bacterium]|nr:HAMP domain-containing protein [Pseudomonadales bacterium]
MKINSISFKLISIALFITTSVLCGLGFYGYEQTKQRLNEQLSLEIDHLTKRLLLNLPGPVWNFEGSFIASTLESEAAANFIQGIYVLNEKGDIIDAIEKREEKLNKVEEIPAYLDSKDTKDIIYQEADSDEQNLVGKLLLDTNDKHVRILLEAEVERIIIQIAALNGILLVLFAIAIRRMTRPLSDLKTVAASIAEGDYDLEVAINRQDEIGELAESFETMKTGIKKKVQDLRDLNNTGDQLALCIDSKTALEKTLHALSQHAGVKFGSVYLYNENNLLELQSFYPPKIIDSESQPKKFEDGEGIVGHCVKSAEVIYIPDTSKDERFVEGNEQQPRSLICVPLKDGKIVMGALNLSGNLGDVTFEGSDVEYAETLARQLVTTIKNIRMRETIEDQNRTLELKVQERTAELAQKNYDMQGMLHNMKQGLFTVVQDGQIHPEYSSFLESVFETSHIAGRNVIDLLFTNANVGSNEIDQNLVAISALIGEDQMMFEFNSHLLAKEYECEINDKKKILSLDWNAIVVDDEINKLMVTVRDITLLKELEHEAANQKRELYMISQLLKLSERKYLDFNTSAQNFIIENRKLIEANTDRNDEVLASLFRNMHTIKGNARTFGFVQLTDVVHNVETTYSDIRKSDDVAWDQNQLLEELQLVEDILQEYQNVHYNVLGRGDSANDSGAISEELIDKIQNCINKVQQEFPAIKEKAFLQPLQLVVDEAHTCSLEEALSDIISSLPSIATELGKRSPQLAINASDVRINNDVKDLITNVFSHLLRNSVDHGIELPEERVASGKPQEGNIYINTTNDDAGHLLIHIGDDGKGINLERLKAKGIEDGKWQQDEAPNDLDVAMLIFESGVSTKEQVSSISGRGVGMDAVRQFLQSNGGDVSINLLEKSDPESPFAPFELVVTLSPNSYKMATNKLTDTAAA